VHLMGCGSSKDVKEVNLPKQIIDKISANLEEEKENLLQCRPSEGEEGETKADREKVGKNRQSELDQDKEHSDSKSLCTDGKLAKERHEQWKFPIGTQVKLLKSVPNSIVEGSLGLVNHLAYNVVGVKFNKSTTIKFATDDIEEWLEVCSDTDGETLVEIVECEIVQPVLYGSASIWAAVNTVLDDMKSPKWVRTQKLRHLALKLINLLEDSGFNPEFEQIVALHEGLSEDWLWRAVLETIVLNFHVPEKQRWMLVAKLRNEWMKSAARENCSDETYEL